MAPLSGALLKQAVNDDGFFSPLLLAYSLSDEIDTQIGSPGRKLNGQNVNWEQ